MSSMPAVRDRVVIDGRTQVRPVIDIQAVSKAARTFTGDFYFTHREKDRLWIAIGDVAGKGLPAAIVMAMIQEELEHRIASCASADCDPARTTQRLHEFLAPLIPRNRFATAVIGWLRDDGKLTLTNAGHPPPLIVRRSGLIEEIGSTGPLLGVLPSATWATTTTWLAEGDALVLYSDGVSEAIVDEGELGVAGLKRLLAKTTSAHELVNALPTGDDLTMLVVRV